jgi:hypothetical protein
MLCQGRQGCWLIDGGVGGLAQSTASCKEDHAQAKEAFTANTDTIDEQGHVRTEKEKENMGNAGSRLP